MNEPTVEARDASPDRPSSTPQPPARCRTGNWLGLIALLLVAAIGGWAAYVYVTGKDGFSWKRFTLQQDKKPEIVAVSGKILFNGEPLVNGTIQMYPADEMAMKGAIGTINKDGTITVYTDVDGSMMQGAYAGKYKVVINAIYPLRPGQLGTTPVLPPEYYKKETTPVELTVFEDPEKNHIVWKLKGTPANPPPGKSAGKKGGGKFDPEALVRRILQSDKNGDGKISRDEASDRLKPNFDEIDTNKDGFLDADELRARFRKMGRGKKGPGRPPSSKRPVSE